jgi:hypothetical protein
LPLDDADRFDRAKPITQDGNVKVNSANVTTRRDAHVRAILGNGLFVLIVLGGSHDLSDGVRRFAKEQCEYIRVMSSRFHELSK